MQFCAQINSLVPLRAQLTHDQRFLNYELMTCCGDLLTNLGPILFHDIYPPLVLFTASTAIENQSLASPTWTAAKSA